MRELIVHRSSFIVFALLITCSLLLVTSAHAQTASPSGSLVQKLEDLKRNIASKAAEIKSEVNKKVQNKAVIGEILRIDDSQMQIQDLASVKTINFNEFTEIIGTNNKKIKITTLEAGDNVATLGDFDDKNNMAAKRIIYLQNYATSSGELVWGQIQKSQGQAILFKNKTGESQTITTNSQTVFQLGNNDASISDAMAGQFMAARGVKQKDGSLRARFIYLIPAAGFVKPSEKSASPSAKSKI